MEYLASTPRQLGQVLKGFRRTKKLTQRETALRGGLLPKTVYAVETIPERATIESLYKLLSVLDVEIVLREKAPRLSKDGW